MTTRWLGVCGWMPLALLSLFIASCNSDLDRNAAQKALSEVIETQKVYLSVEHGHGYHCAGHNPFVKMMEDKGWYRNVPHENGCVFGLTPRSPFPDKPDAIQEYAIGNLFDAYFAALRVARVDVTGIRPINDSTRFVDYRLAFTEQFPGALDLYKSGHLSLAATSTAHFEKYDDGWRLIYFDVNDKIPLGLPSGLTHNSKKFDSFRSNFPDLDEFAEKKPTYRRVELQLSGEWSEKLFTLSDENRTVWEVPGLEARTDTKESVLYPPLGDGHLGAHRWVQFRFPGGGRVKTCSHPKGTTWEICK